MNTAHLNNLASALATGTETTLGPTDSNIAAASLRVVASLMEGGKLDVLSATPGARAHFEALRDALKAGADVDAAVAAILAAHKLATSDTGSSA